MVCSHWPRGGNREPRTNLSSAKGETCRPIGALRYEVLRVEKGERRRGERERRDENVKMRVLRDAWTAAFHGHTWNRTPGSWNRDGHSRTMLFKERHTEEHPVYRYYQPPPTFCPSLTRPDKLNHRASALLQSRFHG